MALSRQRRLVARRVMQHWAARYGLAILLFWATIGLSLLLTWLGIRLNLTIPVVLALVATAWYGGVGPGLLISVLFQGTTIIYTTPSADSTPLRNWFGYFSVFALYVFLVFIVSGMRRIQHRLREQRDLLSTTLMSIGDAVITTDREGRVTFMNDVAERMTGFSTNEARIQMLDNIFATFNERTREPLASPISKVIETGSTVGGGDHTVLRSKDGRLIPIEDRAAPIRDGEAIKGVVLVFADLTERKLAERARRQTEIMRRIVAAQESERHRIARDLHDHLGQQMTALRLKVESLAERCGQYEDLAASINELKQGAHAVDRDIGYLSWELRPTELEELGLENALSTFVREWSTQYGIAAEFMLSKADDAETRRRLDQSVETNLYRIVQEALNNVVKHSDAKNVNVLLQHRDDHTVLIIEDDGRGFEAADIHITDGGTFTPFPALAAQLGSAAASPRGLGLLGMHERTALLNGALQIDSRPGSGTTILARIPVN